MVEYVLCARDSGTKFSLHLQELWEKFVRWHFWVRIVQVLFCGVVEMLSNADG